MDSALKWIISSLVLFSFSARAADELLPTPTPTTWQHQLTERVKKIDDEFSGTFSVFIEDHQTQEVFGYQAEDPNYLASVVKLFVLVEIYRLIELGKLSLKDRVTITAQKYRDGSTWVNWLPVGRQVSIKSLLEAMIMKSDNAATDILLDIAGVANVMASARSQGVTDLIHLTSMLEVRKEVFRQLHPLAGTLTPSDYIYLWKERNYPKKMRKFEELVGKKAGTYSPADLRAAFRNFYKKGANSASLPSLGKLWRKLIDGEVWSSQASAAMVKLLKRCKTGETRTKRVLPKKWEWAHKTGTQHSRNCDVGVAFSPEQKKYTLAICTREFDTRPEANRQYGEIVRAFFAIKNVTK